MAGGRNLMVLLAVSLLANAFCIPAGSYRRRREDNNKELDSEEVIAPVATGGSDTSSDTNEPTITTPSPPALTTKDEFDDDDDDDDFAEPINVAPSTGGGSNIFSLLKLASALFPGSNNAGGANVFLRDLVRKLFTRKQTPVHFRRQDVGDNVIDIDYKSDLTPPFQKQESPEDNDSESSDSDSDSEEHDNAVEESSEGDADDNRNSNASKQDSGSDAASNDSNEDDDDSDYESDDEPLGGGDGQGGGILGLLAGLSGGEDGESDLGTLLAAVSGIVASLSGDGFDLNSIIASGFGLFVGLLSEGEENPGAVIASYLLTSLDTITGGGAKNNGAFFGKFLSKLVKGTSAAGDPDASSEEEQGMKMADSTGFFISLLMSLLGDMSKGSSGGSSHPWRRHQQ